MGPKNRVVFCVNIFVLKYLLKYKKEVFEIPAV